MSKRAFRRILVGAALSVLAGAAIPGGILAQVTTPTPTPIAPGAPAAAPSGTQAGAPDWLLGRWAQRCPSPQVTLFEQGEIVDGGDAPRFRAEVSYAPAGDVVVATIVRVIVGGQVPSGSTVVVRRVRDRIHVSSAADPEGISLERCRG